MKASETYLVYLTWTIFFLVYKIISKLTLLVVFYQPRKSYSSWIFEIEKHNIKLTHRNIQSPYFILEGMYKELWYKLKTINLRQQIWWNFLSILKENCLFLGIILVNWHYFWFWYHTLHFNLFWAVINTKNITYWILDSPCFHQRLSRMLIQL